MTTTALIVILTFSLFSCTQGPKNAEFSDDYVLIEFAAKLEEDHERIYPEPLEKHRQELTE